MKINVVQAKQEIGGTYHFQFVISDDQLGFDDEVPWRNNKITVTGQLVNTGRALEVQGVIQTSGTYNCGRCLENFCTDIQVAFSEIYLAAGSETENEDALFYEGDEIDITDLVRESLLLAEPLKIVCKEECKGLCTVCGTNLNASTCSCDRDSVDPRLAVLQKLLQTKS